MATKSSPAVSFDNVAELLERLGNVPPARVCLRPPPGQATERDLLVALERHRRLYELVEGTLVEKPVGLSESIVASLLLRRVGNFAEDHGLGTVSGEGGPVRLLKGLVRMPDVSYFAWSKFPGGKYHEAKIPDLVPDLAIEVLSESNTPQEIERKLGEYFLAGTRLAWIIDPARRSAEVYVSADAPLDTLDETRALDGRDVLPGFSLPLSELFARLPGKPKKSRKKKS
jgi:Uma2 family endonuclease